MTSRPYVEFVDVISEDGPEEVQSALARMGISGLVREDTFIRSMNASQRRYPLGHDNPLTVRRVYLHSVEDFEQVRELLGDTFPR